VDLHCPDLDTFLEQTRLKSESVIQWFSSMLAGQSLQDFDLWLRIRSDERAGHFCQLTILEYRRRLRNLELTNLIWLTKLNRLGRQNRADLESQARWDQIWWPKIQVFKICLADPKVNAYWTIVVQELKLTKQVGKLCIN